MADNKNFEAYFKKILEIQKNRENRELSNTELKSIAKEIGFSEDDWQAVEKSFQDHYQRGTGFLNHHNWHDAIEELKQAITLKPTSIETLYNLALAYQKKWSEMNSGNDKKEAEKYARLCLEIKPDHAGALKLISDLRKNMTGQTTGNLSPAQNTKNARVVFSLIAAILVVFMGALFVFLANDSPQSPLVTEAEKQTQTSTSNSETSKSTGGNT